MTEMKVLWQVGYMVDNDFSRPFDVYRDEYTSVAYGVSVIEASNGAEVSAAMESICEELFLAGNGCTDLLMEFPLPRSMSLGDVVIFTLVLGGGSHLSIAERTGWTHRLLLNTKRRD